MKRDFKGELESLFSKLTAEIKCLATWVGVLAPRVSFSWQSRTVSMT